MHQTEADCTFQHPPLWPGHGTAGFGEPEYPDRTKRRRYRNRRIGEFLKELDLTQGRATGIPKSFHAPIEKECLDILLRGRQPIIICPVRSLEGMRIPKRWQEGIKAGRILLLSPFEASQNRLTAALAEQRNLMVAALADEVYFGHITPGGKTARLAEQIAGWKSSVSR